MHDDELLPATIAELQARIEAGWAALDDAIDGLDEHQLTQPAPDGGWSIKDQLAHLGTWVRSANAILTRDSRPGAMGIAPSTWESADEGAINDAIIARWAARPAREVLAMLREAQADLRTSLNAMDDDDLALPYSAFQPDSRESDAVCGWIAGNTYQHVAMHIPQIEAARARVA